MATPSMNDLEAAVENYQNANRMLKMTEKDYVQARNDLSVASSVFENAKAEAATSKRTVQSMIEQMGNPDNA